MQWMNVWISIALFVAIAAQVVFLINLVWSRFKGPTAEANPWDSATLEWTTPSPAPHLNWDEVPEVHRGPYEYRTNGGPGGYQPQSASPAAAEVEAT